ncbi:hypothetical protein [Streptomyces sp. NBC_00102]|uniref:hypothetical protein n=1 Tax=Streptomyces sp. NBC_00102 TaxID=2975652 RepID=UPI00225AC6EB|nr:hypothetical protein [Streptomyces sp. NBC_00102]MCX5399849.1 hypothetical protein [Streptomyces sp. NBC_00102]
MSDGLQWMVGRTSSSGWMLDVHFARGIGAEELAVRMGARAGAAAEPMTDDEITGLDIDAYPGRGPGSAVVRVGEHAGWAFAITYGPYLDKLDEVSHDGVEAVHYHHNSEHPPTYVSYGRDGRTVTGLGLCEEYRRYGDEGDLLLPELVAAGILRPDGTALRGTGIDDHDGHRRRSLAVFEKRFGLSLPRTALAGDRLPVYAIMGSPAADFEEIHAWAAAHGRPLPDERLRLVPAGLRAAYEQATDPRYRDRQSGTHRAPAHGEFRTSGVLTDATRGAGLRPLRRHPQQ